MKRVLHHALLLMLTLVSTSAFSQNTGAKPSQFDRFPKTIVCTEPQLDQVFAVAKGNNTIFTFSDGFSFAGQVIYNEVKYSNLQTVLVRSADYDNTIFSISRITNGDRSTSYTGHILNKKYFDGFNLQKDAAGQYKLIKVENDKVLQDCSQH